MRLFRRRYLYDASGDQLRHALDGRHVNCRRIVVVRSANNRFVHGEPVKES